MIDSSSGADDVNAALDAITNLLGELGIGAGDHDTRTYTDMVTAVRNGG